MWTLAKGLKLVRSIQQDSRTYGYHVCLGGGVLNTGASEKDIDIYLIPLDNSDIAVSSTDALDWLEGLWGESEPITPKEYPGQSVSAYSRKVKFILPTGQRIDLFIMRGA